MAYYLQRNVALFFHNDNDDKGNKDKSIDVLFTQHLLGIAKSTLWALQDLEAQCENWKKIPATQICTKNQFWPIFEFKEFSIIVECLAI